jgi:hypothetical protein
MAYEFVPAILFGFLLLYISLRWSNTGAYGIIKIGLLVSAIILIGWGAFNGWAEIFGTVQ